MLSFLEAIDYGFFYYLEKVTCILAVMYAIVAVMKIVIRCIANNEREKL